MRWLRWPYMCKPNIKQKSGLKVETGHLQMSNTDLENKLSPEGLRMRPESHDLSAGLSPDHHADSDLTENIDEQENSQSTYLECYNQLHYYQKYYEKTGQWPPAYFEKAGQWALWHQPDVD